MDHTDLVAFYRGQKMKFETSISEVGGQAGRLAVTNREISYELLRRLKQRFEDSQHGVSTTAWYSFKNDELKDLFGNYRSEAQASENFWQGFFDGVIEKWSEIESQL